MSYEPDTQQPLLDTKKFTLDTSDVPAMVSKAIAWARPNRQKWVEKIATVGDAFFAGHQWSEADEEYLRSKDRPVVTFNRILKTVLLIVGIEIAHRQEPLCVARNPGEPGQKELAEMCTNFVRYALNCCGGDEERTWAFFDAIRRGIGVVELSMDYDEDPDGMLNLSRVDSLDYWWDVSARKPNHKDARWRAIRRFMSYEELLMRFGEEACQQIETAEFDPEDEPERIENVSPIGYAPGNTSTPQGKHAGPYLITQFQWWEWEQYYRIPDPNDPKGEKLMAVSAAGLARAKKLAEADGQPEPTAVKQHRKRYRQTFVCGDVELDTADLPVQKGFTIFAITGLFDETLKLWFGAVKSMVDPQEWANKFYSQTMDYLNRGVKNALILQKDAVENPRKFEDEINGPGAVAVMNNIEGFKQLTPPPLPQALPLLLEGALSAITDISGVNVELLGQSEGDQPGIAGQQRQTQGLTVLAPFFNSERAMRDTETRMIIEYGRKFVADGRLIKLSDSADAPAVQLFRDQMATDYDLVLDSNPNNPNMRMAMWESMQPVLQIAIKAGLFGLIGKIFSFSPYPVAVIAEIQKEIDGLVQKQQQAASQPPPPKGPPPNPQMDAAKLQEIQTASELNVARASALAAATKLKAFAVGADAAETAQNNYQSAHQHAADMQEHHANMVETHHRIVRDNHAHAVDAIGKIVTAVKEANEPQVRAS